MKVAKSKIRRIIIEELQMILSEQDTGETKIVSRPAQRAAIAKRQAGLVDQPTQKVDMEAVIQKQIDMMDPSMYRPEAERLFDKFFEEYDNYQLEILLQNNDELEEIVSKLGGWLVPDLFPNDRQPSPVFVEVAVEFEKANKPIIDNEEEFLTRVEEKVYDLAKQQFAATGAGTEKDKKSISRQTKRYEHLAADRFAVATVIKNLRKENPEEYGSVPIPGVHIDYVVDAEIVSRLHRVIPMTEPELYKRAYNYYLKNAS
jgi:hypothetical protein